MDARYEKVRLDGVIQSQAVLVAIGINREGRRQVLGVELSNRESHSSWKAFVSGLKTRGLEGVEFVVSDDHAGLKRAVRELLPEAVWQRCYVHFLRNALDYLPRKADDDCRQELRWLYDRRNLKEAQQDLDTFCLSHKNTCSQPPKTPNYWNKQTKCWSPCGPESPPALIFLDQTVFQRVEQQVR